MTPEQINAAVIILLSTASRKEVDKLSRILASSSQVLVELDHLCGQFMEDLVSGGPDAVQINLQRLALSATVFGFLVKDTMTEKRGTIN